MATTRNPDAPRDNLIRAVYTLPTPEAPHGLEMRAAAGEDSMPTMLGHFTVFNRWTQIESWLEGTFMERIAPGTFKQTIKEDLDGMRVLFQHGMDFQIGDKPLGPIDTLREEDIGPYFEVPLLNARYVREDILPGLEAELYGVSFRFSVLGEKWDDEPEPSDENPKGLPERTITKARVAEFGPVTFPAYPDADVGVRSLTDLYAVRRLGQRVEKPAAERTGPPVTNSAPAPVLVAARSKPRFRSQEDWLRYLTQEI